MGLDVYESVKFKKAGVTGFWEARRLRFPWRKVAGDEAHCYLGVALGSSESEVLLGGKL
jgi:hypothetical protein